MGWGVGVPPLCPPWGSEAERMRLDGVPRWAGLLLPSLLLGAR